MPIVRTLDQNFFKTWTPSMAYVLGYFAADGSMQRNNRGSCFIEFTSTDLILIESIRSAFKSNHHISRRERGGACKTAFRLQVGSKTWFEDLHTLGFTQAKSNTLCFPKVSEKYLADFIRGYFDGDGCVYLASHLARDRKQPRWVFQTRFTSGSRTFLERLHECLKNHGVVGGRIATKSKAGYDLVLSWSDSLALYRLMYHNGRVANMFLPRKREKLEQAIRVLGLDNQKRS